MIIYCSRCGVRTRAIGGVCWSCQKGQGQKRCHKSHQPPPGHEERIRALEARAEAGLNLFPMRRGKT